MVAVEGQFARPRLVLLAPSRSRTLKKIGASVGRPNSVEIGAQRHDSAALTTANPLKHRRTITHHILGQVPEASLHLQVIDSSIYVMPK